MPFTIQQGKTATIKLKFTNADGSVAPAPSSGGSVSANVGLNIGTAVLTVTDQQTVTYTARGLGTDIITYNGPQGLTATETVSLVATTATGVTFDDTTLVLT
jgi:hypothetical protein